MGHSGTTILARVLGAYDGVEVVGEARMAWKWIERRAMCLCGVRIDQCPCWAGGVEAGWGSWDEVRPKERRDGQHLVLRLRNVPSLRAGLPLPGAARAFANFADSRRRLFGGIAAATGASLIVDESKHNVYPLALARVPGLDVRVVHLVRDSRGQLFHSWRTTRLRPERRQARGRVVRYRWWGTVGRWPLKHLRVSLMWAGTGRVMRVRYEDFCADPDGTCRQILAFCGIDAEANPGGATFDVSGQHMIGGNRLVREAGDEVTVRYASAWHTSLPRRYRVLATILTAPLLLAYGYIGRRSPYRKLELTKWR
jgi:hypothetical protein